MFFQSKKGPIMPQKERQPDNPHSAGGGAESQRQCKKKSRSKQEVRDKWIQRALQNRNIRQAIEDEVFSEEDIRTAEYFGRQQFSALKDSTILQFIDDDHMMPSLIFHKWFNSTHVAGLAREKIRRLVSEGMLAAEDIVSTEFTENHLNALSNHIIYPLCIERVIQPLDIIKKQDFSFDDQYKITMRGRPARLRNGKITLADIFEDRVLSTRTGPLPNVAPPPNVLQSEEASSPTETTAAAP
jgi:hypothetical protein